MKHALMAALLLLTACVSSTDYLPQCGNDQACAERLADEENNRRAGAAALGFGAILVGAAAGYAAGSAAQPTYYPTYRRPVHCNSYRFGNQIQTSCY